MRKILKSIANLKMPWIEKEQSMETNIRLQRSMMFSRKDFRTTSSSNKSREQKTIDKAR